MRRAGVAAGTLPRVVLRLLSMPIFLKILGIGGLVAVIFGAVTLIHTRISMRHILNRALEERAVSTARALAVTLERPLITGDLVTVKQLIQRAQRSSEDVRYVVVRNSAGRVLAHTFQRAVPPDLELPALKVSSQDGAFQVLSSQDGQVFHVGTTILKGYAGSLQVGISDQMVQRELSSSMYSVLWSLAFCFAVGAALAMVLTHFLTRPIGMLMVAARRIEAGDFDARCAALPQDEIGQLAEAFNRMADSLCIYRRTVEEKERARLALLEKIVQAQEDERKTIARELHDQLGQSLSALLLALRSLCGLHCSPRHPSEELELRVREMIDDVRRLAWGIRPSILDDYGLEQALKRYLEEVSSRAGIKIDYQYFREDGLDRLPNRIEVTLYRIVQEAITNILRHAQAARASAIVLHRGSEVTLVIDDDGAGFDMAVWGQKRREHLGLAGIQERAQLLGAECTIDSAPGRGTMVRIRVPLEEEPGCVSAFS